MSTQARFPFSLWGRLHQPPVVTAAATIAYAAVAIAGALTMWHPPMTIESELGSWVTFAWAGFAVFGGAVGAASAPRGVWWLERVGLLALATFLLIYSSVIIGLQISSPGNRFMQLALLVLGAYFCVSRWDRTRGAALDPTRGMQGPAPTTH